MAVFDQLSKVAPVAIREIPCNSLTSLVVDPDTGQRFVPSPCDLICIRVDSQSAFPAGTLARHLYDKLEHVHILIEMIDMRLFTVG